MVAPAATTSPSSLPMESCTTSFMRIHLRSKTSITALVVGLFLLSPAMAQTTIFNTKNFHQDSELWTNPAYYLNNTVGQLRGMAIDFDNGGKGSGQEATARVYGSAGTGRVGAMDLASPYPYKTASEHYQALLEKAKGGTKHTKDTIPDWRG